MKYNLTPIGTHPHEWFMFHGAQYGYDNANYLALEAWAKVYDGDLGIALSDTYTSDVFLKNFSKKHAKLFDGVRQDSGDPFKFINKVINRYKELRIDPMWENGVAPVDMWIMMKLYKEQLQENYLKNAD
jgi:nicotinate phosphoribosyltransferase